MNNLFFNKIPSTWEEYIPLGNGRLGVMQKTHPLLDVLQLNQEGIWSGGPQNRINPDAKKQLSLIRSLIKQEKISQAQELCVQSLSGTSLNQRVYQTAGDFKINFFTDPKEGLVHKYPVCHSFDEECISSYQSNLNLSTAILNVTYKDSKNVTYTRETWVSAKQDLIFMFVKADKNACINFNANLDRGIWCDNIFSKDDCIYLSDSHGLPFTVGAGVVTEGLIKESNVKGVTLTGTNCDYALFYIDIQSYNHPNKNITFKEYYKQIQVDYWTEKCQKKLQEITKFIKKNGVLQSVKILQEEHIKEYESYWNKFSFSLFCEQDFSNIPTPTLLELAKNDKFYQKPLINLYANFSRYLLISSSRKPGILPANLQGIWNCYMDPPWGSKYTININTQMNYWPSNICNLSECQIPLFNLLERAYENGRTVAKQMYNCRGFVLHHNTDFWGDAAPQDSWIAGTYWVLGSAWLSTIIYEHFEYTQDKDFLQKYYYLLHEACLFFVDFLEDSNEKSSDNKPYLVLNPSVSPENTYVTKNKESATLCQGCQMDNMILEHLFTSCIKAKNILGSNAHNIKNKEYPYKDYDDFVYVLNHLKKPELNADGSLMEWNKEVEEIEKGHRHISHLYGLFPGITIDGFGEEKYKNACKKTLENRLQNGGGHTGWSIAWIINFYASLGMSNEALDCIQKLLSNSTLPNLLDNHPPFQIDGNFGSLCGIIRMLVQSKIDDNKLTQIRLLPCLPKEWNSGCIKGVCIKGGYTLDMQWQACKVKEYKLYKDGNLITPDERVKIIGDGLNHTDFASSNGLVEKY